MSLISYLLRLFSVMKPHPLSDPVNTEIISGSVRWAGRESSHTVTKSLGNEWTGRVTKAKMMLPKPCQMCLRCVCHAMNLLIRTPNC